MTSDYSAEAIAVWETYVREHHSEGVTPARLIELQRQLPFAYRAFMDALTIGRVSRQSEVDALQARINAALAILARVEELRGGWTQVDCEIHAALTGRIK